MPRTNWLAATSTSAQATNLGNRSDEIADLVRDFDTMAGELRNLIQSERNLLSGVSHELRSPIARIRLALTLARTADDDERAEMLDRIEQHSIQPDSTLERILTVARPGERTAQTEVRTALAERGNGRRLTRRSVRSRRHRRDHCLSGKRRHKVEWRRRACCAAPSRT